MLFLKTNQKTIFFWRKFYFKNGSKRRGIKPDIKVLDDKIIIDLISIPFKKFNFINYLYSKN
jgi:hypothetical protein